MGWIVERPVTAPNDLYSKACGNFFANMPNKVPLLARKVPCFRAMHDINGKAVIMGRLPRLRFAQTFDIKALLLGITPIHAVREHWHAKLCETLNKHPLKFEKGRVPTGPVSTIVLTLVAFAGKE